MKVSLTLNFLCLLCVCVVVNVNECVLLSLEKLTISNDHSRPVHPSHTKLGVEIPIPAKGKK